jgi:signal transduction histidine kinase
MKFSDALASIIHDMKNSLSVVINTLETLHGELEQGLAKPNQITSLQQEAKRLNSNLIELLALYKIGEGHLSANIDETNVSDLLEEVVAENRAAAEAQGVRLELQCDPDYYAFFDETLIRGVLNTVIGNSLRYTRGQVLLSAEQEDGYCIINVEDDGAGFPQGMLDTQESLDLHDELMEGRTKLGIFFAEMVAKLHRNREKEGSIRLRNNHSLPGGCFSLWLP